MLLDSVALMVLSTNVSLENDDQVDEYQDQRGWVRLCEKVLQVMMLMEIIHLDYNVAHSQIFRAYQEDWI